MYVKLMNVLKYSLAAIISAVGFAYVSFIITIRTAGDSMLLAYLLNVGYILLLLVGDMILYKKMESKQFALRKKNYALYKFAHFDSYISSKTVAYIFYIFVLVASQIHYFYPALFDETFGNYMESIKFCLVIVIAVDKLIDHVYKDVKRINNISAKFKKYETEKNENAET